jgi:alkanesulfonate monooxygenase SsuD/methylene tetrahydromethanopterin reductase-like flavin-dependent oxidoreductase (luciferase family)
LMTNGRIELGLGVGWLREEWEALGLNFATRGDRVNEAIDICRLLWSEEIIEYHGTHFDFGPVVFNPKPVERKLPIHIGGDSLRALRRVVERADGWIGMMQTPELFTRATAWLERACDEHGRDFSLIERTAIVNNPDAASVREWSASGATRLIISPWARSSEAVAAIHTFAGALGIGN